MSKPTKSPWEVFAESSENNQCKCIFSKNTLVAIVTNSDMAMSEINANAKLIAAAPDLYEALERSHCMLKDLAIGYMHVSGSDEIHPIHKDIIIHVEEALAKARGE